MRTNAVSARTRKPVNETPSDLLAALSRKVIGQSPALEAIVPYVHLYQAGLAPEGRPVGVFLLLGPTGTGKTRTVEALAEALHGSERNLLRVDCGEFQLDHEVAKLIGAPPGYLGHRETTPMLTQARLNAVTSDRSSLAIVLFDEVEKAAPSLTRLLLGVLDRATLKLGDNTAVNFERSLIFLTSNLGARRMAKELRPDFGFQSVVGTEASEEQMESKLERLGLEAVKKRFSPEFVNRLDVVSTYLPLGSETLARILDNQVEDLQRMVEARLGPRAFRVEVSPPGRQFLLRRGASAEYGAREMKRTVHKHLLQPLAMLVAAGRVEPGSTVSVEYNAREERLTLRSLVERAPLAPAA